MENVWRVSLTRISDNRRFGFGDLEAALAFLHREIEGSPSDGEAFEQ